jgi:hypothetical protein
MMPLPEESIQQRQVTMKKKGGRNAHHKGALPFRQHENVRHLAYMPERFSHNPCKLKCYSQGIKNE